MKDFIKIVLTAVLLVGATFTWQWFYTNPGIEGNNVHMYDTKKQILQKKGEPDYVSIDTEFRLTEMSYSYYYEKVFGYDAELKYAFYKADCVDRIYVYIFCKQPVERQKIVDDLVNRFKSRYEKYPGYSLFYDSSPIDLSYSGKIIDSTYFDWLDKNTDVLQTKNGVIVSVY